MNRTTFLRTMGISLGATILPSFVFAHQKNKPKSIEASATGPKIIKEGEGAVFNVLGDLQTHKLAGTDTENQIVEWVSNVKPGTGIPPHVHTKEDEIFRVFSGELEMMIDGKVIVLKAGDTAFAPKNVPHSWRVVGDKDLHMVTTAFPSGIEKMFEVLGALPPGPPDLQKLATICEEYGISFV